MGCLKYTVIMDGAVIAEHMEIETAIILVEGLFQRYYQQAQDIGMSITIRSEPVGLGDGDVD